MPQEIVDPVLNRVVGEEIRVMAEAARNLFVEASAAAPSLASVVASLAAYDDADIIDDGRREGEGIPPITVGALRQCESVLREIVGSLSVDPRMASINSVCVRRVRASS